MNIIVEGGSEPPRLKANRITSTVVSTVVATDKENRGENASRRRIHGPVVRASLGEGN